MTRSIAALALTLLSLPAWAGRPLVTDDAAVLERADCEFETFALYESDRENPSTHGGSAQLNCGIGWRSQVGLGTAQARSAGPGVSSLSLNGKTALHQADDGTAFTLAWSLVATKTPGASFEHEISFLNGVMSKPLTEQTQLHVNLGWLRRRDAGTDAAVWALALEHALSNEAAVLGEVFASSREHSPWVQAGLRWAVRPERLFVDASWGVKTVASHPQAFTVGLKVAF